MRDGRPTLFLLPDVNFDDKAGKPLATGRSPLLAILTAIFETLQWTTISGGASLGAIARLFTNLVVRQSPP